MVLNHSRLRVIKDSVSFSFRSFSLLSLCVVCSIGTVSYLEDIFSVKNQKKDVVLVNIPTYPYKLSSVACPNMKPYRILCATVIGSAEHIVDNLFTNLIATKDKCDWAIVSHGNVLSDVLIAKLHDAVDEGVNIVMAADGNQRAGTPKVLFWPRFVPLLNGYDYIWLLDDDMSFYGFDFDSFTASIGLSFPNGPPLISQPVLWTAESDGITPINMHMDANNRMNKIKHPWYWINRGREIAAAQIGFVEMQAPLIDTSFFKYFMEEKFLPSAAEKTGSNWGPDVFWCPFAERYAEEYSDDKPARPVCAVVPITPLLHRDFKTIKENGDWAWKGSDALTEYVKTYGNLVWTPEKEKELEEKYGEVSPDAVLLACTQLDSQ